MTDGIRGKPTPNPLPAAPAKTKNAINGISNKPVAAPTKKPGLLDRLENDAKAFGNKLIGEVNQVVGELSPKPFAEGRDGFVAFDPQTGAVTGGHAAGATVRASEAQNTPLGPLLQILGRGVSGDDVRFQLGDATVNPAGTTAKNGEQLLPLDAERNLLKGVNGKTGGVVSVGISAPGAGSAKANVLALPTNYDGPIFISDIDDSLRPTQMTALAEGKVQPPIDGAKDLLDGVAKQGVPIVYLSAGPAQIHAANEAFLQQFPPGVLLDNDHYGLANFNPSNGAQAKLQADYKAAVLADLREAYPNAKIFGLGDDKYGDAMAYAQAGATAYIHNVSANQANVPEGFKGVITDDYSPAFQAKVLGDLGNALKRSASFGGSPDAPVNVVEAPANPPPIPKPSLLGKLEHLFDQAKALGDGVPTQVGHGLLSKLRGNQSVAQAVGAMSAPQMAQLPQAARAHLADELLSQSRLAGLLHKNGDPQTNSALALSLITAGGQTAGAIDAVLSRMQVDAASAMTGPAKTELASLQASRAAAPGDWNGFQGYLDAATGTQQRAGSQVTPLIDGAAAFPAMYQAIDGAKSSVNYTVYAFHSDQAGWEMARHLADAADRGAAVKVIYDPMGSSSSNGLPTDPGIYAFMRQHGVQVISQKFGPLGEHLTHRKITVVDGKTGFVGGMNVGDAYSFEWHDVHSKVEGPAVADLQKLFVSQWQTDGGAFTEPEKAALFPELAPVAGAGSARVIGHVGGRGDQDMKLAYLRAVDTAQKSINIADPYFSDADLVRHLCAAARRGVAVNLVLPMHNDSPPEAAAERALYDQLRGAGVRVYEYDGKPMAHEKVATFDGKVSTIGSSNLDARSLQDNDEANVWSSDSAVAQQLDQQLFAKDLTQSKQILEYKPGVLGWFEDTLAHRLANLF